MLSIIGLMGTYPYHTVAALVFGYMLYKHLTKSGNTNPKGLPLPPGPKGYPIIGNLLQMPVYNFWFTYDDWCKTYGDLVYFNVLGMHFVILGSVRRATDLLEKRSANYSDRMRMPMFMELMNGTYNIALLPYGESWRQHRKSFHEHFQPGVISQYLPTQRREIHAFMRRLLVTPENFLYHIRHTFAATIMSIAYGITVQEHEDPYFAIAEEAVNGLNEATVPGAFLVDFIPILKYLPSWFPGGEFQKKAAHWRAVHAAALERPYRYVEDQLRAGKAKPSIVASIIERLPPVGDPLRETEERIAQDMAASAYIAGADTTASTVQSLFLALMLYPEVQKKAQAEIDAVIGPNRLPDFDDRPSLPYVNALVKELMRWHLVGPVGLPHMATNDDEYDGYYIPKGTVLLGNAWAMMHDPKTFKNPMALEPERYLKDGKLNPDVLDSSDVAFGFGRRICPGRFMSDNSLYLFAACVLAAYDLTPPLDANGNPIQTKPEFTSGVLSVPAPFKCVIKPRNRTAEAVVRSTANAE